MAGNIFLAGDFRGALTLGQDTLTSEGDTDFFVTKLTPDGAPIWSKRFGDASKQTARSAASDGAGNVIVLGVAQGTVDFGGGPLTASSAGEAFLVKLDPSGNHLWSRLLGSGSAYFHGDASTLEASADDAGGIVISGRVDGELDLDGAKETIADGSSVVAKLDGDGHLLWEKTFALAEISAKTTRKGDIALTGSFQETFSLGGPSSPLVSFTSGPTSVVARIDAQGNEVYKLQFDGARAGAYVSDHVIDESGSITMLGASEDPFILGTALIHESQPYVIRLNPSGFVVYSRVGTNRKYSSGFPFALTAVEGDDGESRVYVTGDFHRADVSPLATADTSAATNGVPDFAGCPADSGDSVFVVGLGPHGELISCRRFQESGYGFDLGPNRLTPLAIADAGDGRLLLSGVFAGTEDLECGTLESSPLSLAGLGQDWVGFAAKISR